MSRTVKVIIEKESKKGMKKSIRQNRKEIKNLLNVQNFDTFETDLLHNLNYQV